MGQKVTCQSSRIKIGAQKFVKILTAEMILFCLFFVSDARFLQIEECLSSDQSRRCASDCESEYSRNTLRKTTTKITVIYKIIETLRKYKKLLSNMWRRRDLPVKVYKRTIFLPRSLSMPRDNQ